MKRIAVLTSGGDASGMNAAIRAAVRTGINRGWEVFGVQHGYKGLISGEFIALSDRDVGGIIQRGGTILGTARCLEFKTEEGRSQALQQLERKEISGLIVIGGDGSQTGAFKLSQMGFPVIGIASTIDNDLYGTEISIGADTALNVALESIDRLKVTASSHQRAFLVEVMGRNCGYLALMTAIAGGAEAVVIPEVETDPEAVAAALRAAYDRGKPHAIAVVAEGARHNAESLKRYFDEHHERLGFELRVTKLGHVQRGGNPLLFDRLLGTQFGAAATAHLESNKHALLLGLVRGRITATPLSEVVANKKMLDLSLLDLAHILER